MSARKLTKDSVAVKWDQLNGSSKGVSGFIASAYEGLHGSDVANRHTDLKCVSELKELSCEIKGLLPSTSYAITVAAFKGIRVNPSVYGDESVALQIKTGKVRFWIPTLCWPS